MDSNNELKENFSEELELKTSIEDFLRELEEKEKDLNMSDEMVIEIEDIVEDTDYEPDAGFSEFSNTKLTGDVNEFQEQSHAQTANSNPVPAFFAHDPEPSDKIAHLEQEVFNMKKALNGRQRDFDNYRNRIERERGDSFQHQISNLATQMLPVLDNLNRALDMAEHFETEKSKDFRQFFDGIALVNQQLNEILTEMGVQPIVTVGQVFDPYFHDAVATEETDKFPPNTITKELLRGYRLGDKLIRAAMVKVASPV